LECRIAPGRRARHIQEVSLLSVKQVSGAARHAGTVVDPIRLSMLMELSNTTATGTTATVVVVYHHFGKLKMT
jgi:hypothetical protein